MSIPLSLYAAHGYLEPEHYHQTTSPELRLIYAVLERAIADILCPRKSEDSITYRIRALQWIYRPLTPDIPFSFGWVCDEIGIPPAHIRKIIDNLRANNIRPKRHRVHRINGYPKLKKAAA